MIPVSDYDYRLPPELIAQQPCGERSASRALFARRGSDEVTEGVFRELPEHLRGDECFVVNDTRVIPARIRARRASGGRVEVFLLRPEAEGVWRAWISPAKRIRVGEVLQVTGCAARAPAGAGDDRLPVLGREGAHWLVEAGDLARVERTGEVPLPPYIRRPAGDSRLQSLDRERYQTVYARHPGAVAAPTAGLHFSPELLAELRRRSIPVLPVTLHVGPGTFRPITVDDVADHRIDPELFEVSAATRRELARAAREGRRFICVGTTSLRALESLERLDDETPVAGETALTVLPGFRFRHAAGLVTNFHLPRSSLLVLVAAFHGRERTLTLYRRAIEAGFRFYSYGDATVILPGAAPC